MAHADDDPLMELCDDADADDVCERLELLDAEAVVVATADPVAVSD